MSSVDPALLHRHTPLEKRYLPMLDKISPEDKLRISDSIAPVKKEEKNDLANLFSPNQKFIDAYNIRKIKETKSELRVQSKSIYNEDGQRFSRVWDHQGFKNIHDPLSKFT